MTQAEPVPDKPQPPQPPRPLMAVRYGYLGWVGQFRHDLALKVKYADQVVVKTERGLEIATPQAAACSHTCPKCVSLEQQYAYVQASGEEYLQRGAGEVVRVATAEDLAEQRRIDAHAKEKIEFCNRAAAKVGLDMRVMACEHLLGGERIIFYFTAEGRIDFRQLVRDLAREYHTRIEMRQIGARDEARIVADFEICGRECCCKNFLKVLRPVNMKMAKLQKATLDPTKVSGRCGRLRCCLRYEQQTYEELDSKLPNLGTRVRVEQGIGFIRDRQIITQLVVLDMGEGRRQAVPVEEILEILPDGPFEQQQARPPRRRPAEPAAAEDNGGDLSVPAAPAGDDEAAAIAGRSDGNGNGPTGQDDNNGNGGDSRPPRRGRREGDDRPPRSSGGDGRGDNRGERREGRPQGRRDGRGEGGRGPRGDGRSPDRGQGRSDNREPRRDRGPMPPVSQDAAGAPPSSDVPRPPAEPQDGPAPAGEGGGPGRPRRRRRRGRRPGGDGQSRSRGDGPPRPEGGSPSGPATPPTGP